MATALYFIDKLALRAGHEKDEDEADTVGCCTLKVGERSPGCLAALPAAGASTPHTHTNPPTHPPIHSRPPPQVENVEVVAPHSIRFDFLGKDSIRYENTVEVSEPRRMACHRMACGMVVLE